MAFNDYKCIDDVIRKYKLHCVSGCVAEPSLAAPAFNEYFQSEIDFNLRRLPSNRSKVGIGEIFMFPLLREVWKCYVNHLSLFNEEPLLVDDDLCGVADYFVCRRSSFGPTIPEVPYLLAFKTERDNYAKAWGQCLAAMVATQKLHGTSKNSIYGIVANGRAWEFGMLFGNVFTYDFLGYSISPLKTLGQVLHSVLLACSDMALTGIATTANH